MLCLLDGVGGPFSNFLAALRRHAGLLRQDELVESSRTETYPTRRALKGVPFSLLAGCYADAPRVVPLLDCTYIPMLGSVASPVGWSTLTPCSPLSAAAYAIA